MGGVRRRRIAKRPTLVLNATPIIYLARVGLAKKLRSLSFRLVTTSAVYKEVVVRGIEKHVDEATELKGIFDSHIIEVIEHNDETSTRLRNSGIQYGEATVISLSRKLKATAVIDDKRARRVAQTSEISLSGTPHVIIQLIKHHILTNQEAKQAVDRIVKEGWYCSAKNYSEIIGAIGRA